MAGQSPSQRFRKHFARSGLALSTVLTLGAVSTLPAVASPAEAVKGANPLQGKSITIIAPGSVGDNVDGTARLFAKYLGPVLHATVTVEDVPGSGQVIGVNRGYTSKPDGTTLTELDMGAIVSDTIEDYPGLKFNLDKFNYIGSLASITEDIIVTHPNSSITFASLMKKGAPKFKALDVRSGALDATQRIIYGAFGIPVQYITAFSSQGTLFQAFEAGQGDLALNTENGLAGQAVKAGKAKAVLSIINGTKQRIKGVPNYDTEIAKYKSRINATGLAALKALPQFQSLGTGVLAAPPGTPKATVNALTQALHKVIEEPAFLKAAATEDYVSPSWQTPASVRSDVHAVLANKGLSNFLGKYSAS